MFFLEAALGKPAEKGANSVDPLPNPELNPLQNPTLGRNMGRWAQVYFTTPPEQREHAVGELLQELENEEQARSERHALREKRARALRPAPRNGRNESQVQNDSELVLICPACEQKNPRHWRYCGMCGAPLEAEPEKRSVPLPTFLRLAEQQESGMMPRETAQTGTDDVEWLRDKDLTRSASRGGRALKIFLVMAFLVAVGVLAWVQKQKMISQRPAALPPAVPAASEKEPAAAITSKSPENAPASKPETAAPETAKARSNPEVREVIPEAKTKDEVEAAPATRPAATNLKNLDRAPEPAVNSSAAESSVTDTGQVEYLRGQQYLSSKNGARNSAEGARWLWKAVTKHNTAALVSLADLYAKGDGVSQNCDQARILWRAAAAKGNTEAANRLRQPGCQ